MTKKRIKLWFRYRWLRFRVKFRQGRNGFAQKIDSHRPVILNSVQKPLFDICSKLIINTETELRWDSIDNTFHVENEDYLLILRYQQDSSISQLSLMDYRSINSVTPVFIDIPFPQYHSKILIEKFDREVHKRMKNKETMRIVKVSAHLNKILKEIS